MIEQIINLLLEKTEYNYYFGAAPEPQTCVAYEYHDTSNDGIKHSGRLKLNIMAEGLSEKTLLVLEEMAKNINSVILTVADNPLTNSIRKVSQNGGGIMANEGTKTTHKILYYDILGR